MHMLISGSVHFSAGAKLRYSVRLGGLAMARTDLFLCVSAYLLPVMLSRGETLTTYITSTIVHVVMLVAEFHKICESCF